MESYCIKTGYQCNLEPVEYDDTAEDSLIYQLDVYIYAAQQIAEHGYSRVLDVGCGCGMKLEKYIHPTGADITGVDGNHAISFCRENLNFGKWHIDNIEEPYADLGQPFDFIISADVVEHLIDPNTLFRYFRRWSHPETRMLISTPERDLRRGAEDMGPPGNGAHVREWSQDEFNRYLISRQLDVHHHKIVELKAGMACCQMALCSWRQ